MATVSRTVKYINQWMRVLLGAGYTRKFLYEARLQEETSRNSNASQSEWGLQWNVCVVCAVRAE